MVVTTLETVPALEAGRLAAELAARRLHLGLLVANKVLPASFRDPDAAAVADALQSDAEHLARGLAGSRAGRKSVVPGDPTELRRVLEEVGRSFADFRLVAQREAEVLEEMAAAHQVTVTVPHLARDIVDVGGLLEIGARLFEGVQRPSGGSA